MASDDALRAQLAKLLDWQEAHVTFDAAVKGIPAGKRGTTPRGWAYSAWQHTCLREILLVADHAAYQVGQIVALRRQLGLWT